MNRLSYLTSFLFAFTSPGDKMKRCYACRNEQSIENFSKNKSSKDGFSNLCKDCARNRNLSEFAKENKKEYNRNRSRRTGSGFTQEEFENKLKEQDYKCAICGTDTPSSVNWHADHCHDTKQKRGILCSKCNMGLGLFKDNIKSLEGAIMYLNHYNSINSEVTS